MKKTLLIALVIVMILIVLTACGEAAQPEAEAVVLSSEDNDDGGLVEPAAERTPAVTAEPGHNPADYSPTTGLEGTTTEYKPIIAQIDNEIPARPQSGPQWADIVYETLIEGIDTRLTCIFNDILYSEASPEELVVGPIRSARYYHQWIQGEWDALFIHQGGAETTGKESYIWGESGDHIKQRVTAAGKYPENADLIYRINNGKRLEHTAYIDLHEAEKVINYTPTERPSFKYYPAESYEDEKQIEKIELSFLSTPGWVEYRYDPTHDVLQRFMSGSEFVAEETGRVVEVQNLIIQYVPVSDFPDEGGRKRIDVYGEGDAEFVIHGKHMTGKWSRAEGANTTTVYTLDSGEEVTLSPGNTWIAMHPDNKTVVTTYADGTTSTANE